MNSESGKEAMKACLKVLTLKSFALILDLF
jgi:hypothetical protein